jgi:hypothetical protein
MKLYRSLCPLLCSAAGCDSKSTLSLEPSKEISVIVCFLEGKKTLCFLYNLIKQ